MEYVVVRQGSYSSYDPVRKGGSAEGEEKPKNRAIVTEYRGLYFFDCVRSDYFLSHNYPWGYYVGFNQLGVLWSFFDWTFSIWFEIGISLKLATTGSDLGGFIANLNIL